MALLYFQPHAYLAGAAPSCPDGMGGGTMHWILDVHYSEDFCRIVNRTIQQNLNMLRKFALSLIKRFKTDLNSKRPLSQIMFNCLLNPSDICTILEN